MGGVTIERSKLDLSQKIQTAEPKVSNDGGGGNNGNKIFNGGGGDGGDDDDDDYFNFEDGDGDGDDGFFRSVVRHLLVCTGRLISCTHVPYSVVPQTPLVVSYLRQVSGCERNAPSTLWFGVTF